MKKIIVTAKEQWEADLRKCVAENGDIDNNPETYKVVDDTIGLIDENELYHLCGGDNIDHFFMKGGEIYSHIWTTATPERVLWNNAEDLDFNDDWFDRKEVMNFLRESIDADLRDGSPIPFYQLIWMGVFGSECECHEYEDYEKEEYDEENDPTPETPTKQPISECVEDVVQDFRDALKAQKKLVWRMICNRFDKANKNIDMERMPTAIADAEGYQFSIQDCGHFFAIVKLEGEHKILYRPEDDERLDTHFDWNDMSYEALIEMFYAMA